MVEPPAADAGTPAFACQAGRGNTTLTPPPPAPSLFASSFQTTSEVIVNVLMSPISWVPPQPSAFGLEAGKSTFTALGLFGSSLLPLSPAATVTVTPSTAPSAIAESIDDRLWADHEFSGPPQLIEITAGVGVACTAWEIASTNPASVFGAK